MKKYVSISLALLVTLGIIVFSTCTSEKLTPDYNQYPDAIGKIVFTKCAIPGCHTDASKGAAAGLSMESWDKLFEGGSGGACVIPYRNDYSTLFYYVNTYSDLGTTLKPTMPYNKEALTKEEVILIKDWINTGAPNRDGFVKFSDNPNRKKFYVTNQGCDVVTVFDQASLLPMRYIDVGSDASTESPHMVKISPDKQHWYVVFSKGGSVYLEKYRTSDDGFAGRANIGSGSWNTLTISNDSNTGYCVDYNVGIGKVAKVNLATMQLVNIQTLFYPHGSGLNNANDTLYVTNQNASSIYKLAVDFSSFSTVNLYTTPPSSPLNPHEVRFFPDGKKYAVTCQSATSPEVRIFQAGTDQLLAIIPVGKMPSELSFSISTDYLFVSCTEDISTFPGKRGSIAVINYKAATPYFVKSIYTGWQPHGIEVDDEKKLVYVANSNVDSNGPTPHHASECGGRNGNVSFIDLNTLQLLTVNNGSVKKQEISVWPYSVAIRH